MSNNVDQRVVQMQFDNQEFERRVKTTRESLKNLKTDLNFDEQSKQIKALEKTANSMDLSGISSGVEMISSKFSAMGAVGFTVMQNLTNSAINFGKRIANSTIGQMISGGRNRALNLEQAQFQISGLGVDWKKQAESGVSLYEQIDKAVSGTAYGLDAAAKVAGQLLASNIEAGTDKMQNALSGISGVAAMTNSSYEEIGHIFTTIAGNGRVMTEQLNQFAGRGLNVAATLAEHLHVTEAELRDMVTKGKVDFNTFAEAMNKAFGEQATKANDTYTGSLSNVKAALSRIGADVQTPYLENMRQTFVALIPVLNSVRTALKPVFDLVEKGMVFLREEAVKTLSKFAVFDDKGKTVIKGMQSFADAVQRLVDKLYVKDNLNNTVFDYLKQSFATVKNIFSSIKSIVSGIIDPIQNAFVEMFPIHNIVRNLSNGLTSIHAFVKRIEGVLDFATQNGKRLERVSYGLFAAFSLLVDTGKSLAKVFGGFVIVMGKVVGLALKLLAPIGDFVKRIHSFLNSAKTVSELISPISQSLKTLGETLKSLIKTFKTAYDTAFAPYRKILKENSKETISFSSIVIDVVSKFLTFVNKALLSINGWLEKHRDNVESFGQSIAKLFGNIATNGLFRTAWNGLKSFFVQFSEGFKKFRDGVSSTIASFGTIKTDGVDKLTDRFKSSAGPLEAIGRFFVSFWELLKSIFSKIAPIISSLTRLIFDGLSSVTMILKDGFDNLHTITGEGLLSGGSVVALLMTFMNKFGKTISKIIQKVEKVDENTIVAKIKSVFGALTDYIDSLKKAKMAEALKDFATSIIEIAVAMLILASIDPERLVTALGAVSALIWELAKVFQIMSNSGGGGFMSFNFKDGFKKTSSGISNTASALLSMAASILLLSLAINTISDVDPEQMILGLAVISGLLWELVGVIKTLSTDQKQAAKGALVLIALALAVKILSKAIVRLGEMEPQQLILGFSAVIILILALTATINRLSKNSAKNMIAASAAVVIFATGIKKLASAIRKFARVEWGTLAKAGVTLAAVIVAIKMLQKIGAKSAGKLLVTSAAFVVIGHALTVLALGLMTFKLVDWGSMAKAGVSLVGIFAAFEMMKRIKAASILKTAAALVVMGVGLSALSVGLILFKLVDWGSMAKAGVTLVGIFAAFEMMKEINATSILKTATAMATMGVAVSLLGLGLAVFNLVGWDTLLRGLAAMAATFIILGVASKLLAPSVKTILALSAAIAIFGIGIAFLGVGFQSLSAGVIAFVGAIAAVVKAFQIILITILESIPMIFKIIGAAIIAFLGVIRDAAPALAEALKAVIISALDTIITIAPKIAETIISLLDTFIPILIKYVPKIVDALVSIIIGVIDSLAERIPELVYSVANFFKRLIGAITDIAKIEFSEDAMKGIILGLAAVSACMLMIAIAAKIAQKAIVGIIAISAVMALMTAMFLILSTIDTEAFIRIATGISAAILSISASMLLISMVPIQGAIMGVVGLAIVIAGLTAILSALGGLSQIDGFTWLVEEGSKVLALIGKAIGDFIGNLIGGVLGGIINTLPQIATALSDFMVNLQPFIAGARMIEPEMLDGVLTLCAIILAFTATELLSGIASLFTGGLNYAEFGKQLCAFVPYMVEFGELTKDIDADAIRDAGEAALALAKFASAIPNSGGLLGGILGENDLQDWAPQLVPFGEALALFSDAVDGKINVDAVRNAADAGVAIANMAKEIPNEGGWLGAIVGENSLSVFGPEMADFGTSLAVFSSAVDGKVNADAVENACKAGVAIAEMSKTIPNEGGVAGFFAGENSLSVFGPEMESFGTSLANFSAAVTGKIDNKAVLAATIAGTLIAKMADTIPNEGGVAGFFAGENSLSKFGPQIADFGKNLAEFCKNLGTDFNAGKVMSAALGGKMLAEMTSYIPNQGGVAGWFKGESSLAKFGPEIAEFGTNLSLFNSAVKGNIDLVWIDFACKAGKMIAEMISTIPNEGGIKGWFAGESNLSKFGPEMADFGTSLAEFSQAVSGKIDVASVSAASEAGKNIAEMVSVLPKENGIVNWFQGESSLAKFGPEMVKFGTNLAAFSFAVKDSIDADAVKIATEAGTSIAEMANTIPDEGGIKSLFDGDNSLVKFGPEMVTFGTNLAAFSFAVQDSIDLSSVKNACEAGKAIASMANSIPDEGGIKSLFDGDNGLAKFGPQLGPFGTNLAAFSFAVKDSIDVEAVKAGTDAGILIAKMTEDLPTTKRDIKSFGEQFSGFGKKVKEFYDSLADIKTWRMKQIVNDIVNLVDTIGKDNADALKSFGEGLYQLGKNGINEFAKALSDFQTNATDAISKLLKSVVDRAMDYSADFKIAGEYFVNGLAIGIINNRQAAVDAARYVAQSVVDTTHATLDEHSPSRIAYKSGKNWDLGWAGGILGYSKVVTNAVRETGTGIIDTTTDLLSGLSRINLDEIDVTPTIRPVMDLSGISAGVGDISSLMQSVQSYSISSAISSDRARLNRDEMSISVETTSKDVVGAVKSLTSRIDQLEKAILNRPIELDGDRLTKKLAPGIDRELGKKQFYSRRGN